MPPTESVPSDDPKTAVVIGAGITGLSAALLLSRHGVAVTVHEAEEQAGGLLAPILHEGMPLDRGSHRVHPEAHPLLLELTREAEWQWQQRSGTLVLKGRHLDYPLQPLRFLWGLGLRTVVQMGSGWLTRPKAFQQTLQWESDRQDLQDDKGFERFVIERVGRAAYQQFYEPYARKVWGIDPNDLSQSVAKQRVSTSNPAQSVFKKSERRFLYPKFGMAALIQLLRTKLEEANVNFVMGSDQAIQQTGCPIFHTGHLSDLVPDSKLHHRGLYLLHVTLPDDCLDETDTWYTPEHQFWFGRVSQPARFTSEFETPNHRVLCLEIPEGRWGPDKDFTGTIQTIMSQLHRAKIVNRPVEAKSVIQTFLPRVYPMYTRGWIQRQRQALRDVAQAGNIYCCGRQGLFLHCNMDQAVATADAAVNHWLKGGTPHEWAEHCQTFADFRVRD